MSTIESADLTDRTDRLPVGRLAYTPGVLEDEPLDGYLEYVAAGLHLEPRDLHRHLGLTSTTAYGLVRDAPSSRTLLDCLGLTPEALAGMTLRRYASVNLMPPKDKRGHGTGVWARASGARYCSECLLERDYRWRLRWYLQWTFACLKHQRLLSSTCPGCERPVRGRSSGHPVGAWTVQGSIGGERCACTTTMLAHHPGRSRTLEACVPQAVFAAQSIISGVIDGAVTPRGFGHTKAPIEWLSDVAALTRLLAVHYPTDRLPSEYAAIFARFESSPSVTGSAQELVAWTQGLRLEPTSSPAVRLRDLSLAPVAMALTATAAIGVVTSPSAAEAKELLAIIPSRTRRAISQKPGRIGVSWQLAQALDNRPTTITRGVARTAFRLKTARLRADGTVRPALDPSLVPARLWPVALDLHPTGRNDGYAGLAASAALLSIGNGRGLRWICRALGHDHVTGRVEQDILTVLGVKPNEDSEIFNDLIALHDSLLDESIPIDYARRRRTFDAPSALTSKVVRRVAHELEVRPTQRLGRFAAWWVYELLTGNDFLLSSSCLDLPAGPRIAYRAQRDRWAMQPPDVLLRIAERHLLVNCLDEPLFWSPGRTNTGAWMHPAADTTRRLEGWNGRPTRRTSRPILDVTTGLELEDAVRFAVSGQTRSASNLGVRMARFAVVVEVGTITRAAERVGVRQSSMTDSITALERELGLLLLDRGTHGISVTDVGHRLHQLVIKGPLLHVDPGPIRAADADSRGRESEVGTRPSAAAQPRKEAVR